MRVAAPPERGRANETLVGLLVSVLEVPAGWLDAYGLGAGTPVEGLPALVTQ